MFLLISSFIMEEMRIFAENFNYKRYGSHNSTELS